MKTVFTGAEVPHIFATQRQPEGRNSNGSLWFVGPTLYSYREPIAHFFGDAVLISDDRFSVTTSKHQSWASYALNHFERVRVPQLKRVCEIVTYKREMDALEYIKTRMADIASIEESMKRMRAEHRINAARAEIAMHENACALVWAAIGKRSDWRKRAAPELEKKMRADRRNRYDHALRHIQFMAETGAQDRIERMRRDIAQEDRGPRMWFYMAENCVRDILRADMLGAARGEGVLATATWADAQKLMGKAFAASYRAHIATLQEIVRPIQQEADAWNAQAAEIERAENAEKIERWLSGENVQPPRMSEILFRVVGEEVQSSHGARVPLADAIRVVRMAARCRDAESRLEKSTFATGVYRGIAIDEKGNVRIGCHRFTWRGISEAVARFVPDLAQEVGA